MNPESSQTKPFDPIQEVRFAIVMYGGVSLAIYINGVAQELLHMVRATAPSNPISNTPTQLLIAEEELAGTERVYRKLGRLLGSNRKHAAQVQERDPVRTRFVIDILSGTSAGGINGVFLAKALANNQSIDKLQRLWIEEGDIARLINDKISIKDLPGVTIEHPPASLLNSRRMYVKLLDAISGMETGASSNSDRESPLTEELDLFVTATDIYGLTLPLKLADKVIFERRYRNVFHFLYASEYATGDHRNDFLAKNDPFLAFSARCTSAFPFAFEPMTLRDVADASPFKNNPDGFQRALKAWEEFFKDYLRSTDDSPSSTSAPRGDFLRRAFGDGGYLDNKPFSYATETLTRRRTDFPATRKLIYIEPSPENPESEPVPMERPDVVQNVSAALLTLPREETIRQDLELVTQRNRLIERVNRITQGIESDVRTYSKKHPIDPLSPEEWAKRTLPEMIATHGPTYGGYHRLKVAALTDELTDLIARVEGFDAGSDEFFAIRYLVRAWRDAHYAETPKEGQSTQNQFLMEFDLSYRIRRLNFIQKKIDQLHALDKTADTIMKAAMVGRVSLPSQAPQPDALQQELRKWKCDLNQVLVLLRRAGRLLRSRSHDNPLRQRIADLNISRSALKQLLEIENEDDRTRTAEKILSEPSSGGPSRNAQMEAVATFIREKLKDITVKAAHSCEEILRPPIASSLEITPIGAAQQCLWHYYENFEQYDLITFPIFYETEVGEADTVAIVRISPEDATNLVNERESGCRKLAGTTLANFGGFLERRWRESDMMWGRLDAAERLITTVLLDHPEFNSEAESLISEAQAAILAEEVNSRGENEARQILIEGFLRTKTGQPNAAALQQFIRKMTAVTHDAKLLNLLNESEMVDLYNRVFQKNHEPEPESLLRSLARATQVVGNMLDGLSDRYVLASRRVAWWLVMLGRIVWGLIEVAVPRKLGTLIFHYWLRVLYLFEAVLIVGGVLLGFQSAQKFGILLLAITAALDIAPRLLGAYLQSKKKAKSLWFRILVGAIGVGIVLAGLGVIELLHLVNSAGQWLSRGLR
jgi:patatin-related protein